MKFEQCIKPRGFSEVTAVIHPLNDNEIVVIDTKGRGETFKRDKNGNFVTGKNFNVPRGEFVDRMVSYTDKNGVSMLLMYNDSDTKLFITNFEYEGTINMKDYFSLIKHQEQVYIITSSSKRRIDIIHNQRWEFSVEYSDNEIPQNLESSEYQVASINDYRWRSRVSFDKSQLDLSTIPPHWRWQLISNDEIVNIYSFCIMGNKLFCGHDGGISIWTK